MKMTFGKYLWYLFEGGKQRKFSIIVRDISKKRCQNNNNNAGWLNLIELQSFNVERVKACTRKCVIKRTMRANKKFNRSFHRDRHREFKYSITSSLTQTHGSLWKEMQDAQPIYLEHGSIYRESAFFSQPKKEKKDKSNCASFPPTRNYHTKLSVVTYRITPPAKKKKKLTVLYVCLLFKTVME